jgi:hypothetical protein
MNMSAPFRLRTNTNEMTSTQDLNNVCPSPGSYESAVVKSCPYCPKAKSPDKEPIEEYFKEIYDLYHRPCAKLLCSESNISTYPLCARCRHLRIWHFASCLDNYINRLCTIVIRETLQTRETHCQLCHIINAAIVSAYNLASISEKKQLESVLSVRIFSVRQLRRFSADMWDSDDIDAEVRRSGRPFGRLEIVRGSHGMREERKGDFTLMTQVTNLTSANGYIGPA